MKKLTILKTTKTAENFDSGEQNRTEQRSCPVFFAQLSIMMSQSRPNAAPLKRPVLLYFLKMLTKSSSLAFFSDYFFINNVRESDTSVKSGANQFLLASLLSKMSKQKSLKKCIKLLVVFVQIEFRIQD